MTKTSFAAALDTGSAGRTQQAKPAETTKKAEQRTPSRPTEQDIANLPYELRRSPF